MVEHPGSIKRPDIEIELAELVETNQGAHPVVAVVGHDHDVAAVGDAQRVRAGIGSKPSAKARPDRASIVPVRDRRPSASVSPRIAACAADTWSR